MIPAIAPDTAPSGCFANGSQVGGLSMFGGSMSGQVVDGHHHMLAVASSTSIDASSSSASAADTHSSSLLYSLSILKDKVQQVQSLVTILIAPAHQQTQSTSMAVASMGTLIQEIVVAASSMMFTCQQMNNSCSVPTATVNNANNAATASAADQELMQHQQRALFKPVNHGHGLQHHHHHHHHHQPGNNNNSNSMYPSDQTLDWFADNSYNSSVSVGNTSSQNSTRVGQSVRDQELPRVSGVSQRNNHHHHNNNNIDDGEGSRGYPLKTTNVGGTSGSFDIIELNAAELLAKYTHYCHICGKGFKRDANLRMHMRAHGDEYKTSSALSNPLKNGNNNNVNGVANAGADTNDNESNNNDTAAAPRRKYSCPHEGCRWNQRHAKFQPLKSMICVKNHYKRSHCPKMYVCKRCNRKQFSVLSDLRTHEKHCGDLKWQCSCGTTFSRKDKLMGHVALFVGHTPALPLGKPAGKIEGQAPASSASMQMDDRVEL